MADTGTPPVVPAEFSQYEYAYTFHSSHRLTITQFLPRSSKMAAQVLTRLGFCRGPVHSLLSPALCPWITCGKGSSRLFWRQGKRRRIYCAL